MMYWPADTYFVPPNSKGHVNQGERNPPSLSGSVEKKKGGLRDVLGIFTVILSSGSSFERATFFYLDLDLSFGLLSELAATLPLAIRLPLAADFSLETALRLALGNLRELLHRMQVGR
jgi:hypothetical protein